MNNKHENHNNNTAEIALKKAQTSIKNILGMIEADAYCIDILQQILAVNGLLRSASEKILENHLQTCFLEGMSSKKVKREKEQLIKEVIDVINLNNKSK